MKRIAVNPLPRYIACFTWITAAGAALWFILRRCREVLDIKNLSYALGPDDPDPWLRLAQVREWLTGGDFFSHVVSRTNAPVGGISTPWTRPFDALLAFMAQIMPGDIDTRLMLAAAWLPPLLGLVALYVLSRAGRSMFRHTHVLWCLVMMAALNPVVAYFAPGASDHHALQVLLWCGALACIAVPPSPRKGLVLGSVLGVMLWVSPEALLVIALVYALLGTEAVLAPERAKPLALAAVAASVVTWLSLFVERPVAMALHAVTFDTVSLPHAVAMSLAASGALLLNFVSQRGAGRAVRIQSVLVSAVIAVIAMAAWFPRFFRGPLADVDPFILTDFLPNVVEARPLFEQPFSAALMHLWQPILAAFLFCVCSFRHKRICALLLATACLAMASARWTYYLQPVALLSIAVLTPAWSVSVIRRIPKTLRPYAFLWSVIAVFFIAVAQMQPVKRQGLCRAQQRYLLQSGQVDGRAPLNLYTASDISGQVLFFTKHSVIAGNYHREGPGLRDLKAIARETNPDAVRQKLAKRKTGAMLVCPSDYKRGWIKGLTEKKHPAWLAPATVAYAPQDGPKPLLFLLAR